MQQWIARYETEEAKAFLAHDRNCSYDQALKEQAVREYLSSGGSFLTISKKYGLRSTRQLGNWIKMYNAHGDLNSVKFSGGGSYMKTQEERIKIANVSPVGRIMGKWP